MDETFVLRLCSQFEAEVYADRLRAAGIPAEVRGRGPRYHSGLAHLVVPEADAERAEAVIRDESDALPVPDAWAPRPQRWWRRRRTRP